MANEKQLSIEVKGKVATLKSQNFTLVGGNNDYDVVFDFDEDWNNRNVKTALFVFGNNSVAKVFEGNICNGVAINNSTVCYIGVFAGDIVTTTPAEVNGIRTSITDIGGTPKDPEPSVYNQIIELLNKYIEQGGGGSGGSGFSPTIKIEPIKGGNRVTITDINGEQSFDVMDGKDGEDYILTEADKNEIADEVKQKIEGYTKGLSYVLDRFGTSYTCDGIGTATDKDIVVASKINGIPVKAISSKAFVGSGITSIVIPESVEWIADGSLACDTLKTVKIYGNLIRSSEQMGGMLSTGLGTHFIGAFENYEVDSNGYPIIESITTNNSVTDIYVWWDEGYIDYAPWGAVAAKIHYKSLENSKTLENRVTSLESSVMQNSDRIDQVKSIAEGANQAISFYDYGEMASTINKASKYKFKIGQNLMIVKLDVPDLWVSGIDSTNLTYTHTSDAEFVNSLKMYGTVQVGYYILSALETQKVDLTEYAKTSYVDRVVGDINTALDELHTYAQGLVNGGATV